MCFCVGGAAGVARMPRMLVRVILDGQAHWLQRLLQEEGSKEHATVSQGSGKEALRCACIPDAPPSHPLLLPALPGSHITAWSLTVSFSCMEVAMGPALAAAPPPAAAAAADMCSSLAWASRSIDRRRRCLRLSAGARCGEAALCGRAGLARRSFRCRDCDAQLRDQGIWSQRGMQWSALARRTIGSRLVP